MKMALKRSGAEKVITFFAPDFLVLGISELLKFRSLEV